MKKLFTIIILILLIACKKEKEYCWQVYDMLGNSMGVVCEKTESEIKDAYGPFYDKADVTKFCWKFLNTNGTTGYVENLTEKMASYWLSSATNLEKVVCGYCQTWYTREKDVLKSTGQYSYQPIKTQQYCGDTCATIYTGRLIILRETPDSIIYHEFLEKK
ncbi:MAG TPA: hypothetical protein VGQ09_14520 [Chitinophagaceae bacterium]|nr:hypothetical protein [Chitinophagaceae bacterium]